MEKMSFPAVGRTLLYVYKDIYKFKMSTITSKIAADFSEKLVFFVNGQKIEDNSVNPEWTLLYYLRFKLRLTGTKIGCKQGGCGACTVMISQYDRLNKKEVHFPINSCLFPICSIHGLAVTTVEGVSTSSQLHPVQERIAKAHGSQCGFCTPGMVMSMYALLRQNPKPRFEDIVKALKGNVCRCTGYRPILDGFRTFTEDLNSNELQNNNILETKERLFKFEEFALYDPSQEPIFPLELKNEKYDTEYLKIKGPQTTVLRPATLRQLLNIKHIYLDAKIIAGNTNSIFEFKFSKNIFPLVVNSNRIPEMTQISETINGIKIGATATTENIRKYLEEILNKYPEEKTRLFKAIINIIHCISCKQVRHAGSMGGNIITSSSTCDLLPILLVGRVQLEIHSKGNARMVVFDPKFNLANHKDVFGPDELLVAIHLPFSNKYQYYQVYKQARRRDMDECIINLAVKVQFVANTTTIGSIFFGIGGAAAKPIEAPLTQAKLKGLLWTKDILEDTYQTLLEDINLNVIANRGMVRYRQTLVLSLFLKAFLAISERLQFNLDSKREMFFDNKELSGIKVLGTTNYKTSQFFHLVPGTQSLQDFNHRSVVHMSAFKQATGEAVFVDDMPRYENELSIAYILSHEAHANIVSIDASKALEMKGVHSIFSENHISPEANQTGRFFKGDEQVFYSNKVTSEGQIICAILAEDQQTAQKAANLVKVEYESLEPVIITIQDAIKHNSFFIDHAQEISHGNVDGILKIAPHVIKGSCRIGNQKHFYLETQSCLVVPQREDDAMDIYSSTQCPTDMARVASDLLGVYKNKIKVHVKRVGGAFGGKEWKSIVVASPAILAAQKLRRPIRCVLERNQDLIISGGRTSYLFNYTVGFDEQGKILACDFEVYLNCGHSLDIKHIVLRNTLNHLDNAFKIEAIRAQGQLCKTNIPSTTTMTGYGAPEGQFPTMCIIEEIAEYLKKDAADIVEINLYNDGDITFYGQKVENCTIKECWNECVKNSDYWKRRSLIDNFNRENIYKKRGISIIPSKFGVGLGSLLPVFQQAAVVVNIYTDGSVLLSYGGVEQGQGLHTKMIQLATRILDIPAEKIHINEISTYTVPNSPPTVASISSDIFGAAVVDACEKINEMLRPYKADNPDATWQELIFTAHCNKVNLSATGLFKYKTEGCDLETGTKKMFNYFVAGAACSEIELDVLTGDHEVLRTDIVLDVGKSLNPAIDIGQIEGAFIQGYGLFVMEDTLFSLKGTLLTKSLGTYKLPGVGDIPKEFNICLLEGSLNPIEVSHSKAVEEPSFVLASSVYFAIKDAIKGARAEYNVSTVFNLDNPATAENIRMACTDEIIKLVMTLLHGSYSSNKKYKFRNAATAINVYLVS